MSTAPPPTDGDKATLAAAFARMNDETLPPEERMKAMAYIAERDRALLRNRFVIDIIMAGRLARTAR